MQETLVQFLDWEDPLEKGKAATPVFWPGGFTEAKSSLESLLKWTFLLSGHWASRNTQQFTLPASSFSCCIHTSLYPNVLI